MRNPYRLSCILLLFMLPGAAPAQRILVAGVKQVSSCEGPVRLLQADLRAIHFPKDWTFVVACNPIMWETLQRAGNAFETHTGFTNLNGRTTVLNARIYAEMPPLSGSRHATTRLVLQHELGHVLCGCGDEWRADEAGGVR